MSSLELGVVGNCQISVLVDSRGRFVWGSFPRMDADPMFCSLLGGEGADGTEAQGCFDIEILDFASARQEYIENTPILKTTLTDRSGAELQIVDFAPRYRQYGRMFHPVMVIRNLVPVKGRPAIRLRMRPAADYGASRPTLKQGSNHVRYDNGHFTLRLTTNAPVSALLEERAIVVDEALSIVLGPDETATASPGKIAREMFGETRAYWEGWVRALSIPFEWQDEVIRAAITLKLCTFEDTGAVLAALTTSVPEAPRSGRNWDYRYCWLRDSFYVVHALNRLGATKTMQEFLRYLFNLIAEHGSSEGLQPVYGISGETELPEEKVESLAGYRGMGPVRRGNDAYRQRQNDIYGATVLAVRQLFFDRRLARQGGVEDFESLEKLGERARELFDQPDAGLWEYRGRNRVHTYSSAMCWAACDRLAKIAKRLGLNDRAAHWNKTANTLRERILEEAWSEERQSLVGSFGGTEIDASLLTLADLGFIEPQDSRFLSTVRAIEQELKTGPYLFRYDHDDDFGRPKTAFNICTFWYIDALAAVGRREEARELFTNMLAKRNALGLLSEDLDPKNGELWGNFPQTYSMVGIIMGAMRLSRAWEEVL